MMFVPQEKLTISLSDFNGPLDLLLHLIRTQELDIFDLPIAKVTDQFLQFIHQQLTPSLDSAGEYLYMAANLIKIKSRFLLPTVNQEADQEAENDPRLELVQTLLEYQRYQDVVGQMSELQQHRALFYTRPVAQIPSGITVAPLSPGVTLQDLQHAFLSIWQRRLQENPKKRRIERETFSISDKIHQIKELFRDRLSDFQVAFDQLFKAKQDPDEMITTFLAILELAKDHFLHISQNETQEIYIAKRLAE